MMHTLQYAMSVYYEKPKAWSGLIERGMRQDFSWGASVREYEKLYEKLTVY